MKINFKKIYLVVARPLRCFIAKRTGESEQVIDEIFSLTISAAWQGYKSFKKKSSFFTWVCRIALNKIADYYRGQVHKQSQFLAPFIEDLVIPDLASFEEQLALEQLKLAVNKCLDLLPTDVRKILQLRYWQEATLAEIGQFLGISTKAAEVRLYRARKAFSKLASKNGLEQV